MFLYLQDAIDLAILNVSIWNPLLEVILAVSFQYVQLIDRDDTIILLMEEILLTTWEVSKPL